MEKFTIQGGFKLNGTVTISGNKNEALPAIAACILTEEKVCLENVPHIGDVLTLIELLEDLGAVVDRKQSGQVVICCKDVNPKLLDSNKCRSLRAAILLAGPMLARFKKVVLPPPGGDVIGRRRLDTHFLAFEKLGAEVHIDSDFHIQTRKLIGTDVFLDEQSVTATENAMMAAVLAEGKTVLRNAACEPHVVGLGNLLNSMGARISGHGSNTVVIEGVSKLHGATHRVGSDFIEVGSYIALAVVTQSELTLKQVHTDDLHPIQLAFNKLGIVFEIEENQVYIPGDQKLSIKNDISGCIPKLDDGTWPAFPTDLMSILIVAATQADGAVLIFEKMYDGRMFFVDSLISMGAQIVMCDPHRIVVIGPSNLYGSVLRSPDIRAGMALIIAALCAKGESTIYNISQIDRGYEDLELKLQKIGAHIKRVKE
ncbi:MAG: UDP-N-acetylglucosamine 1-carboxyvinyltransferase [Acidobacteria bacterium]|nr:MAG: UDP-N-acetylglucosamine 1-carboxyvinyltransferase [Acidobacteriota bacterium]